MAKKIRKTREQIEAKRAKRQIYDSLPECTSEQQNAYFDNAQDFIESTHWYTDCKGVAKCAIADYLAFSDGYKLIRLEPYVT